MATDERTPSINPGYALGQLARALTTSTDHADAETRARAQARVERWHKVLHGMMAGTTTVGSRTPVEGAPAWATLEVVKGGFATGNLLAGGPLQTHENDLLTKLGRSSDGSRAAINAYYVTDAGLDALKAMLHGGGYRIEVPEQGALLVVASLIESGDTERARELLDIIVPFFDRLQFYPIPNARPLTPVSVVRLRTVGEVTKDLHKVEVPRQVQTTEEALTIWAPLCDRAVALFLETVDGPAPSLVTDENGALRRRGAGYVIEGGWPCRRYPDGWLARARQLLEDESRARATHRLCRKSDRRRENYARLRTYLERCAADPRSLTGRDVGMIRKILASVNTKRGLPGSTRLATLRQAQAQQASLPTSKDFSTILIRRLENKPSDDGLASIEEVTTPVEVGEAKTAHASRAIGAQIPEHLVRKLLRCLEASIDTLVARRVITSSEVIARVLPQITAQVSGAGIIDPALRLLHSAIYAAFRRRRSLLLMNLEHQVRIEELPWMAAIAPFMRVGLDERERARQTLEQFVLLTLASFPYVILPNKLLQEIRTLAKAAAVDLPIVDEVAADIFMGTFSEKYLAAAKTAGQLLEGTLYERYYGLSYERVRSLNDTKPSWGGRGSSDFAKLCGELAGSAQKTDKANFVAQNGTVIEQEQILTTHNLAPLFIELRLREKLPLADLARDCFKWICRQHQMGIKQWRARLQMAKNTAYAWRQMVFFLAVANADEQTAFVTWSKEHLAEQSAAFRERFSLAARGLWHLMDSGDFDTNGRANTSDGEARRFLGWTTDRHWLLG